MKLLVAVDSSPASPVMADEIASRPWPQGTVACVLYVTDLFALAYGISSKKDMPSAELKAGEAIVRSVADKVALSGIEVMTKTIEGYPPTAIVDEATEWGADFITIGSHGHGRLSHFLLGSVARTVVRTSPCSVEIIRAQGGESEGAKDLGARGGMKILVATDGSDYSAAAARSVAARPWPGGTAVKVLSVVDTIIPTIEPWFVPAEAMGKLRKEAVARAQAVALAACKVISDTGLESSDAVLLGNPKALITETAKDWGADLIVVGSHGRRGFNRILLGSISEAVAMHAHCSVEVIRLRSSLYGR